MAISGPIIIVEDDEDDMTFYKDALDELGYQNKPIYFRDARKALDYLKQTSVQPFIIFVDMNLPGMN